MTTHFPDHPEPRLRQSLPPDARIILPESQPQRYDLPVVQPRPGPVSPPAAGGGVGRAVREFMETILPAVLIALLIHLFLAQATRVEGYSMEPTLFGHQRLVIEKLSYHFHEPKRDDIVVLRVQNYGRDMLIKRVIGLPGETIEVREGQVFINGAALDEPYLAQMTGGAYPPTIVPEGYVFVMGDNRNNSNDSRSFGPISFDDIVGRAWIRYWPLNDAGLVE